jgi:hypothetical protein
MSAAALTLLGSRLLPVSWGAQNEERKDWLSDPLFEHIGAAKVREAKQLMRRVVPEAWSLFLQRPAVMSGASHRFVWRGTALMFFSLFFAVCAVKGLVPLQGIRATWELSDSARDGIAWATDLGGHPRLWISTDLVCLASNVLLLIRTRLYTKLDVGSKAYSIMTATVGMVVAVPAAIYVLTLAFLAIIWLLMVSLVIALAWGALTLLLYIAKPSRATQARATA